LTAPPEGCVVEAVPEDAALAKPVVTGPLELVGLRMSPDQIDRRQLVWIESYWRIPEPTTDYWVATRLISEDSDPAKMWWADHVLCDWMWPTSRWEVGKVYRDRYSIRPRKKLPKGAYQLYLAAMKEGLEPEGPGWRGPSVTVK